MALSHHSATKGRCDSKLAASAGQGKENIENTHKVLDKAVGGMMR